MLLDITAYLFCTVSASTGTVNIVSVVSVSIVSFEMSSLVILNDPSHSNNVYKSFSQC